MDENISPEVRAMLGVESERLYTVTSINIKRFAQAIGDNNPLYFDEEYAAKTTYGGIVAPPLFFQSLTFDDVPVESLSADGSPVELNVPVPAKRAVGGSSQYELFIRARPGDEVKVVSKLNNVFTKTGRSGLLYFIESITEFRNKKNELMARETANYIKRI